MEAVPKIGGIEETNPPELMVRVPNKVVKLTGGGPTDTVPKAIPEDNCTLTPAAIESVLVALLVIVLVPPEITRLPEVPEIFLTKAYPAARLIFPPVPVNLKEFPFKSIPPPVTVFIN